MSGQSHSPVLIVTSSMKAALVLLVLCIGVAHGSLAEEPLPVNGIPEVPSEYSFDFTYHLSSKAGKKVLHDDWLVGSYNFRDGEASIRYSENVTDQPTPINLGWYKSKLFDDDAKTCRNSAAWSLYAPPDPFYVRRPQPNEDSHTTRKCYPKGIQGSMRHFSCLVWVYGYWITQAEYYYSLDMSTLVRAVVNLDNIGKRYNKSFFTYEIRNFKNTADPAAFNLPDYCAAASTPVLI